MGSSTGLTMGTGDRNTMPSSGDYHAYQSVQQQTPQTRQSPARQMLQQISPRLKDFQLMVEQLDRSMSSYGSDMDTHTFRLQMKDARTNGNHYMQELANALQKNKHLIEDRKTPPSDRKSCDDAFKHFKHLVGRFKELAQKSLKRENDTAKVAARMSGLGDSWRPGEMQQQQQQEQQFVTRSGRQFQSMDETSIEREIQEATLRDMEQLEKDMSVVMEVLADIAETIDRGAETIHEITREVDATVGVFEETMDNLEQAEDYDSALKRKKRCCCYLATSMVIFVGALVGILAATGSIST